jgi:hypothetical protein
MGNCAGKSNDVVDETTSIKNKSSSYRIGRGGGRGQQRSFFYSRPKYGFYGRGWSMSSMKY